MPLVQDTAFQSPLPSLEPPAEKQTSFGDAVKAAVFLENDVYNLYELSRREAFPIDESFSLQEHIPRAQREFDRYPEAFTNARSAQDFDAITLRVREEERQREILAGAGGTGVALAIASGVVSPTLAIPLIGSSARGLKALGQGLAFGAAAGALQSAPLSLAQETRGDDAFLFDVGAGAILGGLLGGAVGLLRPSERALLIKKLEAEEVELDIPSITQDGKVGPQLPVSERLVNFYKTQHEMRDDDFSVLDVTLSKTDTNASDIAYEKIAPSFTTTKEAVAWITKNAEEEYLRIIASKLYTAVADDMPFFALRAGDKIHKSMQEAFQTRTFGRYEQSPNGEGAYVLVSNKAGIETALHEIVHEVTFKKLHNRGKTFDKKFFQEVTDLQNAIRYHKDLDSVLKKYDVSDFFKDYMLNNPQELLTMAMTNKPIYSALKELSVAGKPIITRFIEAVARALGFRPDAYNMLHKIFDVFERNVEINPKVEAVLAQRERLVDVRKELAGLRAGERQATVARYHGVVTEPTSTLGAQQVEGFTDAGKLKGLRGTKIPVDWASRLGGKITQSPVVQAVQQDLFQTARVFMQQLSNAGLRFEKNADGVVTSPGGTVENRIGQWYRNLYEGIKATDAAYQKYIYGLNAPKIGANTRAVISGFFTPGRLSKDGFNGQISRALREGPEFAGPAEAKEAAESIRKSVINPLTDEMVSIGLLKAEDVKSVVGDLDYLHRMYDTLKISNDKAGFIRIVARNFKRQMETRFAKAFAKLKESEARDTQLVKDLGLNAQSAKDLRNAYLTEMKILEGSAWQGIEDTIDDLLKKAREERKASAVEIVDGVSTPRINRADEYYRRAQELIDRGGEDFQKFKVAKRETNRRIRNLSKTIGGMEEKHQAKLDKAARQEELQLATLDRLIRAATKLDEKVAKLTPGALRDEFTSLVNRFAEAGRLFDKTEERISVLLREDVEFARLLKIDELQTTRFEKLNDLAERIEEANARLDNTNELQALVKEARATLLERANDINSRRARRIGRLQEQAEQLHPDRVRERIARVEKGIVTRRGEFARTQEELGGEKIDVDKGEASFDDYATERAREVTDRILGTYNRIPSLDMLTGERGAELARVLDIPSREMEDFLENDVELIMRSYLRTSSSDIEMFRKFGSVNAAEEFRKLALEFEKKQDAAKTAVEKERIRRTYETTTRNLEAVIGRLRHTWGIPNDPFALSTRMARVFQNLNTLRFMGGVVISSIPDVARVVMKYGLQRSMKHAFLPMMTDLKNFKLSAHEARLAGEGLDPLIHSRAYQMFDIMDNFGRTSKVERGLEFVTSRIGTIALFDYWTAGMKQIAAVAANAQLVDALGTIAGATRKSGVREATELLASAGIDGQRAADMWALISKTAGGGKVGKVYLPNTEAWLDPVVFNAAGLTQARAREAQRTYRAAMTGELRSTIVTPGVERPTWMDSKSLGFKLIAQFRSFTFASNTKTLMAGLQQSDMAILNGVTFSLALGMVSYYLWAKASGGEAEKEMLNAGFDKWADEAIARSGLIAILSEVQRVAQALPLTEKYASFSGEQQTRRGGDSFMDATMGPTLDLVSRATRVASQVDDPTQSTLHTMRTLMPFQNLFYLRQLFDHVEESTGEFFRLPERRQ